MQREATEVATDAELLDPRVPSPGEAVRSGGSMAGQGPVREILRTLFDTSRRHVRNQFS